MINIIVSRFPNFEMRMNSGLAIPSQVNDLNGIRESNQTLLVVHNDKIKRKIRSNLSKGSGKLLAPTFTFRSLFNHLSGFTCKAQSVISKLEQAFRMRKAIIETGVGSSAVSTELIKNYIQLNFADLITSDKILTCILHYKNYFIFLYAFYALAAEFW